MRIKHLYLLPFISASMFVQNEASSAPLVSIGDNTDIFFNGSSSLRWSSNIFRNEDNEKDDIVWTFSPGFVINVGRGVSNADLSIITRYDIVRYQDNDKLDTELFHIKANGSYKTSRLDLNGSVSFDEEKSNSGDSPDTDDLIDSENTGASLNGEYRFSPKLSFGAGVRYTEKEYQQHKPPFDRLADRETVSVPLNIFYELTPKVDLSIGYIYTENDIDATSSNPNGDYTSKDHFYNLGARGNLLPKLSGFFRAGYRTREDDRPSSDESGSLGFDADLKWSASPKLTVRLDLSHDFGVGGEGQSTENSSVDLSGNYSISSRFAASANLGYTLRDYTNTGREDDQYKLGARLTYSPNQLWRYGAGYTYVENDSSDTNRSYESHTLDLTASLRY
ncbi:MAG: hypothetical protein ACI9ZV_000652 [Candidatus Azotimanducaceae bacterium]|jgi:hypothetical protein